MRTNAFTDADLVSEDVDQEGTRLVFDRSDGSKYKCRKYKRAHGPNLYCGFSKDPIEAPGGGKNFVATIFQDKKEAKGRKRRFPVRVALFRCHREAREAALLWFCQLHGMAVDRLTPGLVCLQERRKLLEGLDGHRQLISLVGPVPRFHVAEAQTKRVEEPVEGDSSLSEPAVPQGELGGVDGEVVETQGI